MSDRVHDYHDGNRYYQDLFDTRRLADYITKTRVQNRIDEVAKKVIQDADMFLLRLAITEGCPLAPTKEVILGSYRCLMKKHWPSQITTETANTNP